MSIASKQPVLLPFSATIYQNSKGQKITEDSARLIEIVTSKVKTQSLRVLDIGSGTGIISIMLSHYTDWEIKGFEIQKQLVELARENNVHASTEVEFIEHDIREKHSDFHEYFDLIVSNPPYFKADGRISPNPERRISRSDETCKPIELLTACAYYLKPGGTALVIYPDSRLAEIDRIIIEAGFELKNRYSIQAKVPKTILEVKRI